MIDQILKLCLEDQLTISVALQYMELINTFRDSQGLPGFTFLQALDTILSNDLSSVELSENGWDIASDIRFNEISDGDAIDLAIEVLKNVAEKGYC